MAKMMLSAAMSSTSASSNFGLKRPSASNTEVQWTVRRPLTLAVLVPGPRCGPRRLCRWMPSSSPSWTSISSAGISVAALQADDVDFLVAAHAQGRTGDVVGDLLAASHFLQSLGAREGFGRAQGGTRHVVGDVAAADDHDAPPERQRLALVEGAQEIHAVDRRLRVSAPGSGSLRPLGRPMPRKIGLVAFLAQAGDGEVAAQVHVALQIDAQREDGLNLVPHQLARQAEDRHADRQHAAGLGVGLEDRDLVAELHQVVRHGEARHARADHRDASRSRRDWAAASAGRRLRGRRS